MRSIRWCCSGVNNMTMLVQNVLQMQQSIKPLARQSLAEQVADQLRDLVLLEKLAPGSTIPERETADALGVSRTPLRESLRILAAEGLVDIAPNLSLIHISEPTRPY